MSLHSTHTYVEMEVSQAAHDEIKQKLVEAGYDHAICDGGFTLHMQGIALTIESHRSVKTTPYSVEAEGGCEHCGHDRQFAIVFHNGDSDEFQLSTAFGDQETAEWIAKQLNDAFERGRLSSDSRQPQAPQSPHHALPKLR